MENEENDSISSNDLISEQKFKLKMKLMIMGEQKYFLPSGFFSGMAESIETKK